jgi:hypothetical protein
MDKTRQIRLRVVWTTGLLLAAICSSTALAAVTTATLDPKLRYQRESAACNAIRVTDDRANCRSEASTRFASTQPANLAERQEVLLRNALRRCDALPAADRQDCVARMQGQGTTTGSVDSGGIYRELVTIEVGIPVAERP